MRGGHIAKGQHVGERARVGLAGTIAQAKQGLGFGCEDQAAILLGDVQPFDTETVAHREQALLPGIP
jgi:hypothetical protein